MTQLPESLFDIQSLVLLDLGDNQLDTLSPKISQLKSLQTLDLSCNLIKLLPPEIGLLDLNKILIEGKLLITQPFFSNLFFFGGNVGNPLISFPKKIISQGTKEILDYLRKQGPDQGK